MNTKQGLAPAAVIAIFALLIVAAGYSLISQKVTPPAVQERREGGINLSGIDPLSLSMAPVPDLNGEYQGISTTAPLTDTNGTIQRFNRYHFSFELLSQTLGCNSGAYQDLGVLGYTLMGGVPTAVTLVSERVCGTGYFPHVVLYQATGECRDALVGCERDTKIAAIAGLIGDRIHIGSVRIEPDYISITYLSKGESESTTVNLEYVDGTLVRR